MTPELLWLESFAPLKFGFTFKTAIHLARNKQGGGKNPFAGFEQSKCLRGH